MFAEPGTSSLRKTPGESTLEDEELLVFEERVHVALFLRQELAQRLLLFVLGLPRVLPDHVEGPRKRLPETHLVGQQLADAREARVLGQVHPKGLPDVLVHFLHRREVRLAFDLNVPVELRRQLRGLDHIFEEKGEQRTLLEALALVAQTGHQLQNEELQLREVLFDEVAQHVHRVGPGQPT